MIGYFAAKAATLNAHLGLPLNGCTKLSQVRSSIERLGTFFVA